MKAILISIRPQWVAKILNVEKTIEIRKKFPKDYVGWVYIYCTKEDNLMKLSNFHSDKFVSGKEYDITDFVYLNSGYEGKGKVVARFWCDKVEEIEYGGKYNHHDIFSSVCYTKSLIPVYLRNASCLEYYDMNKYLEVDKLNGKKGVVGTAIHIDNLEIFDEPKEISEFYNRLAPNFKHLVKYCEKRGEKYTRDDYDRYCEKVGYKLTRAPQSWCYVKL